MAANASAVWRVRPSGNNNNGGGFDCAISSAATGSSGSWTTSGGTTTFTDATAGAFTTGMVNSAINISGVGQFTILSRVDANNITITTMPPWLPANSNFGSAANWTVGSGTDYSQQNSAQVTQSSTANTSTSTTTLTDTGASFTAALIGNGIRVAGTGITTTFTYITAVPSSTTLTLQTSPGTTGTSVSYNIGGGWADFVTNTANAVPGNTHYILGGASPSYGAADYTVSTVSFPPAGNTTAGLINFMGDPATPTTNGFGGFPLINVSATGGMLSFGGIAANLFIFATANSSGGTALLVGGGSIMCYIENVVIDQNGYDAAAILSATNSTSVEIFSSAAKRSTNAMFALTTGNYGIEINNCNIHNCIGPAVKMSNTGATLEFSIIAKNGGDAITSTATVNQSQAITNNTIDGNAGNAIVLTTQATISTVRVRNNLITNHTTAGKYAITVSAGTQAANDRVKGIIDYNVLYNNAGNYNAISPGAHDTVLSSDPYVGQSTENYTLA